MSNNILHEISQVSHVTEMLRESLFVKPCTVSCSQSLLQFFSNYF